jgi:hypothetical protein
MDTIDSRELCKRVVKYILEGLVVGFACLVLPKQKPDFEACIQLALVAAATFAILDLFAPSISQSTRQGAGLGIGLGLVGGMPLRA